MKTADIEVGGHYAYRRGAYGNHAEVEVLGFEARQTRSYGPRQGGIKVRFVGYGNEQVVRPQDIHRTWAEQERVNKDLADATRQRLEAKDRTFKSNARRLRHVEDALRQAGLEPRRRFVYGELRPYLEAEGFQPNGEQPPYADDSPTSGRQFDFVVDPDKALKYGVAELPLDALATALVEPAPPKRIANGWTGPF